MAAETDRGGSAVVLPVDDDSVSKLSESEIEYLVLEGGGGKGFAYLGALEILEQVFVLERLKGVAGTSAGAITALMLGLRMGPEQIAEELKRDFNEFFDLPYDAQGRRLIPSPLGYFERKDDKEEKERINVLDVGTNIARLLEDSRSINFDLITKMFRLNWDYMALVGSLVQNSGFGFLKWLASRLRESRLEPLARIVENLHIYLAYLERDMGFFSGKAARDYFDMLIRREAVRRTKNTRFATGRSLTFADHREVFGMDLLMCGANMSTGRTVLFSWKHTPWFPVADAVRISMGLPLVYKPYVISSKYDGWPECGTYVDGGVWNNLPFREIGALGRASEKKNKAGASAAVPNTSDEQPRWSKMSAVAYERKTLGLRLDIEKPEPITSASALLRKWGSFAPSTGESQVIADMEPFTLILDTEGLSLLDFNPPEDVKTIVGKRSRRAMREYLDLDPVDADADPEDEMRIRMKTGNTVCFA